MEERKNIVDRWHGSELKYCVSKDKRFLECLVPTTLDEYCSPSLSPDVLHFRNRDQVLGRYYGRKAPDNSKNGGIWKNLRMKLKRQQTMESAAEGDSLRNILFVRQVWIWKIGDHSIITPQSHGVSSDVSAEVFDVWHQHITSLLNNLVRCLGSPVQGAGGSSLLTIYENALVGISKAVTDYTKIALIEDIDLDNEQDLFHQISDLREEVSMIKSVLEEQEEVWVDFMSLMQPDQRPDYHPNTTDTGDLNLDHPPRNEGEIRKIKKLFAKYKRRITKLEEDTKRAEQNMITNLDFKQKHATIKETHGTAMLGAAVCGFTTITVIFAPLSFVVALFALPIDKFTEGKIGNQRDGVYLTSYIRNWSGKLACYLSTNWRLNANKVSDCRTSLDCCDLYSDVECTLVHNREEGTARVY